MLRGEKIVFTGKLDTLSRKQAQALVTALGGKPQVAVQRYHHSCDRESDYESLPGGLTKSKDAKSGSFAAGGPTD